MNIICLVLVGKIRETLASSFYKSLIVESCLKDKLILKDGQLDLTKNAREFSKKTFCLMFSFWR